MTGAAPPGAPARQGRPRPQEAAPEEPAPAPLTHGRRRGWGALAVGMGWWLLPALVLAGLGGALVARRNGLWYDELYTAEVAPLPLADLARAVVTGEGTIPYLRDAPPSYNAPYYAVAHLWLAATGLAPDEVGLRLLSLVAAVGGVAAATRAVGRLAGRRVALAFGLVTAANPFVVEYAAEARGYGLALLAAGLLALAFARWIDRRPGATPLVGVAAAGLGLAHWFGLLVVGALAVAIVVLAYRPAAGAVPGQDARRPARPGEEGGRWWPRRSASATRRQPSTRREPSAISPGPASAHRGPTRSESSGGRSPVPALAALAVGGLPAAALVAVAVANGVGGSGAEWIADVGGAVPRLLLRSWSGGSDWLLVLTLVLAGAGAFLGRGRARTVGAAWLGVPVAAVALVELVRPVYVDRYLLPALLGLALLVALGAAALRPRWLAVAAGAAVVAASAAASVDTLDLGPKEDVRAAVAAVAAGHRPGQPVVAAARWDALGLDHYARTRHPFLVADLVLPPAVVPDGAQTVWVVRRDGGGVQGDEAKAAGLYRDLTTRGLRLADERRFPGRYAATLAQRWSAPAGPTVSPG